MQPIRSVVLILYFHRQGIIIVMLVQFGAIPTLRNGWSSGELAAGLQVCICVFVGVFFSMLVVVFIKYLNFLFVCLFLLYLFFLVGFSSFLLC